MDTKQAAKTLRMKPKIWFNSFSVQWLLSPWAIFGGIIGGIAIGFYNKQLAGSIYLFGRLYLDILQMCVIPIMITAIVSSLGNLLKSREVNRYLFRLIAVFTFSLFLASSLGIFLGFVGKPGKGLDLQSKSTLGSVLSRSSEQGSSFAPELEVSIQSKEPQPFSLLNFFFKIVPTNIFKALNQGENMKILFFSIILGVAVAFIPSDLSEHFLTDCNAILRIFEKVIIRTMYFLPIGLCCLFANQIANVGLDILLAMMKFVVLVYIGSIIFITVNTLVISFRSGKSVLRSFFEMRETIFLAFGTRNSFATMPFALRALTNGLKFEDRTINLVIPLGLTLCRYGTIMTFSFSVIFFAQLYDVSLGVQSIVLILVGSVLAGMAAAGSPGVIAVSMLALVLEPLGLPSSAAIILLIAIDPVTDPIITAVNVHANCGASAMIAETHGKCIINPITEIQET